jgi:hypothetical protein
MTMMSNLTTSFLLNKYLSIIFHCENEIFFYRDRKELSQLIMAPVKDKVL